MAKAKRKKTELANRIEDLVLTLARENEALREELRQTRAAFSVWAEVALSTCRKFDLDSARPGRHRWTHQAIIADLEQLSQTLRNSGAQPHSGANDLLCA